MQFDEADKNQTNLEAINELYKEEENKKYKRPKLVFWNVAGSTDDFPATTKHDGTCLVSGFSPTILKSITSGEEIDSVKIMMKSLRDERYDPIRKCLE